ncbi:MAG: uncharacterized protein K0S65_6039 [Labilithrix sp.]|nr:uncharacterized protein [Labilithrix sp.]
MPDGERRLEHERKDARDHERAHVQERTRIEDAERETERATERHHRVEGARDRTAEPPPLGRGRVERSIGRFAHARLRWRKLLELRGGIDTLLPHVAHHAAVTERDHARGARRDVVLVGDEHDRDPAIAVQPLQEGKDLEARPRIEIARRLVGEEHRRPSDERARDRDALLLTAGELIRCMMHAIREPHGRQRLERLLAPLAHRDAAIDERELHVLERRGAWQEVEALKDEADEPVPQDRARIARAGADVEARELVRAARGAVEAAEDVH